MVKVIGSIKINPNGLFALLKDPAVAETLHEQAARIHAGMPHASHFEVRDSQSAKVARSRIYSTDMAGLMLEKRGRVLSKALGGGTP